MRPSPRSHLDPRDDDAALCARQVLDLVPRAMRLLREEMRREAGAGLSVPQFRVLAFLGRSPGASLSAVATFLGVADATASAMVDRLVRRRLLTRGQDPAERRRVALALTAQGTTLLARSRAHTRAWMELRLAALSRPELRALANGLALLDRALGAGPEPGGKP